jgi:(2Fe-2S) ferredoxin
MKEIAYKCHVLVCVNDREGERKSCADNKSKDIRLKIKETVKEMGWPKKDVRVSQTLCLGLCEAGPNVMIYPQNILFSNVTMEDVPLIVEKVGEILEGPVKGEA